MRTRPRGIERGRDRIASRAGPSGPHRIVSRTSAREGLAPTTTPLTSGQDQPPSAWTSRAPIRPYSPSRPSAQSATRSPLARRGAPQPAANHCGCQPLSAPTPRNGRHRHLRRTPPPPVHHRPDRPGTSQPIAFQRMQNWRFHHQSGEGPAAAGPVGACAPDPTPSTPPGPTPPPPAGLAGPTASRPAGQPATTATTAGTSQSLAVSPGAAGCGRRQRRRKGRLRHRSGGGRAHGSSFISRSAGAPGSRP